MDPSETPGSHNPVTIDSHKLQGVRALISALEASGSTPLSTKECAVQSGLGYGYVRHLLPRLARDKKIVRVGHGYYTLPTPPSGVELRFENVVLKAMRPTNAKPRAGGVSQSTFDKMTRKARGFGLPANSPTLTDTYFRKWHVHTQEFPNGTITVQCGSRDSPTMAVTDLLGFFGWVEGGAAGILPAIPDNGPGGWEVVTWELNHDFSHLRLDGRAVTLQVFKNLILKLYQKPVGLRVEIRQKTNVSMETAVAFASRYADELAGLGLISTGMVKEGSS